MENSINIINTDADYMRQTIHRRDPKAHKGNFGRVLIFAGSTGMAGAAVLGGRAALRGGAGLVQYLLPDFASPLLSILQISVPEATCIKRSPGIKLNGYNSISAGSGLGQGIEAKTILSNIICSYRGVLVLDADALNMVSVDSELSEKVRGSDAEIIITPHIGEAKRLLHTNEPICEDDRVPAAVKLAENYNCIAVLKGSGTIITDHSGIFTAYKNTTGNPGMATAGSGDVLAGLIASLAAQGYPAQDAARMGVFIHGKAGDLAAKQLGEMGLTASDIVQYIPYALNLFYPAE